MTPEQARNYLDGLGANLPHGSPEHRALRTLAAMTVESDYRVVDPDTVDGRYETRRYERHVSEWREVKK